MVDVALYEAVFNLMESTVPEYDQAGVVRARTGGALPGIVPSNTYTCADGEAIVIAGNGDAIFKRLMLAIGRDDLAHDPQLARNDGRVPRTQEIDHAIQHWCEGRGIDAALAALAAADVPVSRIYSVADMFRDAQYAARGMIERHALADGSLLAVPAVTPKLSATPGGTRWLGPALGEHTDQVLAALGYDAGTIATLRAEGVI
jgi:crotonobetainyl-CoA:carnitine CoA-transferase CaiB-like acyl-CoA transferase